MRNAIKKIMEQVTDECVITSCGYISREVYRYDRPRNFYILGAMGSSLGVGLGLAHARPDLKVIVIQGDGATLMSLGSVALYKKLRLNNLFVHILNNNCYASTGGQDCIDKVDFICGHDLNMQIVKCGKESKAPRVSLTCREIKERFRESIHLKKK